MRQHRARGRSRPAAPFGTVEVGAAPHATEGPLSAACPELSRDLDRRRPDLLGATSEAAEAAVVVPDFDRVYRDQRGHVLAAVRSVLGGSDEIEDVVQLAFLEIYRCLPRFQGRSRLSTWVYRIALNVALQHLRRRRRKRWLMLGRTGDELARERSPQDPVRHIEQRELLERVYAVAAHLSEKKKMVWILHELRGMRPEQIAEILEIPMNTVRSRLQAARKDLFERLARQGISPPRGR